MSTASWPRWSGGPPRGMRPLCAFYATLSPIAPGPALTLAFAVLSTLTAMAPPYSGQGARRCRRQFGEHPAAGACTSQPSAWLTSCGTFSTCSGSVSTIRWSSRSSSTCGTRSSPRCSGSPSDFTRIAATGELMSRVVDDVNHVERVLLDGTEQLIVALLTLVWRRGHPVFPQPVPRHLGPGSHSPFDRWGALVHPPDAPPLRAFPGKGGAR